MSIFSDEQSQQARELAVGRNAIAKPTGFEQNMVAQFESYMTLDALGADRKAERDLYEQRLSTIRSLTGNQLEDPFSAVPSWLQPERDRTDPETWTGIDKAQNTIQDPIALAFTLFAGREGGNEYQRIRAHEEEVERIRLTLPPRDRHLIPTRAEIEAMVKERAQKVEATAKDVGGRADLGGLVGGAVGSMGAAITTPEQLVTLPIGAPAKVGLLARVLIEASIGAGTEAVLQPAVQDQRADLGVESGLGPALENIVTAGAGGGLFALGGEAVRAVLKGGVGAFRKLTGREPTPDEHAAIDLARAAVDAERATPYEDRTAAAARVHQANDEAATMAAIDGRALEEEELVQDRALIQRAVTQGATLRTYTNADIEEIGVNAELMQFKGGGDDEGVTDRLRGITEWNVERAGISLVYEFTDGTKIIADGHQRLGLAKRLAAEGKPVELPTITLREADGITPGQARARAAFKNIAEGTGTPTDAAKVMRELGVKAEDMNLPPKSALVRDAEGLQNLNDDVFGMVINDLIDERMAAIIGRQVDEGPLQTDLAKLLIRLAPANASEAESIIAQAKSSGVERSTQTSLFGEEDIAESLYLERARVLDRAVKMVRRNTATFRTLLDQEGAIAGAGNVLDQASNAARLDSDRRLLQYVQTLANRKGPISDALTEAARAAKSSGNYQGPARQFVEALNSGAGPGALDGDAGRANGGAAEPDGQDPQGEAAATRSSAEQVVPDEDTLAMFDEPVGPKVDKLTDRLERELVDQVGEEEAAAASAARARPVGADEIRAMVDEADAALTGDAGRAVDEFVGHTAGARDRTSSDWTATMGIMRAHGIEAAARGEAPEVASALEAAFAPIREKLRAMYGDVVRLYRVQQPVEIDPNVIRGSVPDDRRAALSWTADQTFARSYAGVVKDSPVYGEADIAAAEAQYAATKEVRVGPYTLREEEFAPGLKGIAFYRGEEFQTDTDSVRDFMEGQNEWAREHNATQAERAKSIVSADVPLDEVLWVTDRAGQAEFIVRNGADRPVYIDETGALQKGGTASPSVPTSGSNPSLGEIGERASFVDTSTQRADIQREGFSDDKAALADLGEKVKAGAPRSELDSHPAVAAAIERAKSIPETHLAPGYLSDEWRANRQTTLETPGYDAAVDRLYEDARVLGWTDEKLEPPANPVAQQRRAIIVMGPPAAGKSTIANPIARRAQAMIVDADEAKKLLPEFQGGVGANAVHEESSELANLVLERAMDAGDNLVLPKVGSSAGSLERLMKVLKDSGYTVDFVNMRVDADVAYGRMIRRFVNTGRLIPPSYMDQVGVKPTTVFAELKAKGEADGYSEIDGNPGLGQPKPILEDTNNLLEGVGVRLSGGGGRGPDQAGGAAPAQEGFLPGFQAITDAERMAADAARGLDGGAAAPLEVGLFNDMLRGQTDLLDIPIPVGERIDANGNRVAETMSARQILDDLEEEQDFMEQLNQCDLLAVAAE